MERRRICGARVYGTCMLLWKTEAFMATGSFCLSLSLCLSLLRRDLKQRKVKRGELVEANGGELMDQNYPRLKVLTSADEIAFHPPSPRTLHPFSIEDADREIHL